MKEITQVNGRASYEYVASIFGDRMLFKVQSRSNSLLWDTLSVTERVPDLELLPERAYYEKIGGRCNHYGPRDDTTHQGCRTPDNNHWGTARIIQALDSIAANYRRLFPSDTMLQINDISLPLGGRFDIYAQWAGDDDHVYHRLGIDVDIRRTWIPQAHRAMFEQLCR